jgi:hypothetical protein
MFLNKKATDTLPYAWWLKPNKGNIGVNIKIGPNKKHLTKIEW